LFTGDLLPPREPGGYFVRLHCQDPPPERCGAIPTDKVLSSRPRLGGGVPTAGGPSLPAPPSRALPEPPGVSIKLSPQVKQQESRTNARPSAVAERWDRPPAPMTRLSIDEHSLNEKRYWSQCGTAQ